MYLLAQDLEGTQVLGIVIALVILVVLLVIAGIFARYFRLWIQCALTHADVTIWDLLGMTFRKVNPTVIVRSKIMAVQSGIGEEGPDQQGVGSPLSGRW